MAEGVSKWQELKLSGQLEGMEEKDEDDIYSEARVAEVSGRGLGWAWSIIICRERDLGDNIGGYGRVWLII